MYHVAFCTVLQNTMARYEVNHKFVILWQFSKKSLIAGRSNYGQRRAQGRPGPHGRRLKQPPPPPLVYAKAPPSPPPSQLTTLQPLRHLRNCQFHLVQSVSSKFMQRMSAWNSSAKVEMAWVEENLSNICWIWPSIYYIHLNIFYQKLNSTGNFPVTTVLRERGGVLNGQWWANSKLETATGGGMFYMVGNFTDQLQAVWK